MISVEEAQSRILRHVLPIPRRETIAVHSAIGRVLARDVIAIEPNPRFTNSALDGYAVFCAEDAAPGSTLQVVGQVAAGDPPQGAEPGQAVRVFTGAPLIDATYSVAYQEDADVGEGTVTLQTESPRGQGIRLAGSDFRPGENVLNEGHLVNAGSLAVLASQGIIQIEVLAPPTACVIVTGNEISHAPGAHQIYDSNSAMLKALTESAGCGCECNICSDDFALLRDSIKQAAGKCDAVIVSGGASVGDYDFLARATSEIGQVDFHGVAVKPGKPFLFGKVDETPLFGLPGNPASAFVTFELFVRPALMRIAGNSEVPKRVLVSLNADIITKGREEWLRCKFVSDGIVEPASEQGSFGIRSLAAADALVCIPANTHHKSGEVREALMMQHTIKSI